MPGPLTCIHRGSQRRSTCCLNKTVSRWICRAQKASDGFSPIDCVPTVRDFDAQRELAPSAHREDWPALVKICENCPLYEAITPTMPSEAAINSG